MCIAGLPLALAVPERVFALLLKEKLGVDVPPEKIGPFIRENWWLIAPLAHAIHEKKDPAT